MCRDKEPGLSLLIPLPHDEITPPSMLKSVIIHYSYAVLKGILEVTVNDTGSALCLNADNLIEIATSQNWQGTLWEDVSVMEVLEFVKQSINTIDFIELAITDFSTPEIDESSFNGHLEELRSAFSAGNLLAFRIPISIHSGRRRPEASYFNIFVRRYPHLKRSEEMFIRSGIVITERRTMGNRPVRGLFVAEDIPITTFLGDCETPAHTEWNERTEDFREKYPSGAKTLRFLKKSMSRIVSLLDQPPQETQRDFLKDIFYITEPSTQKDKTTTKGPEPPPPPEPRIFRISPIERGFNVGLAQHGRELPIRAHIAVAYDVRKGNAFRQYEPFDFDLGSGAFQINATGCKVVKNSGNVMEIFVTEDNFGLEVTGFDPMRDLAIKVTEEEMNETQI